MIQDVAAVNITHTSHQLEASIATLLDDFDMMFEPTAVPRPSAMGRLIPTVVIKNIFNTKTRNKSLEKICVTGKFYPALNAPAYTVSIAAN